MTPSREAILSALFAQLLTVGPFTTSGRQVRMVQEITAFPALFLVSTGTHYPPPATRGLPQKRLIDCQAWLYTDAGKDPDAVPETALHTLLDSLEQVLAPPPVGGVLTLGGLVSHCWIEGTTEQFPGVLGGVALAIVPIKILVP